MSNGEHGGVAQLIFFGVIVLFSIISSLLQQKRKNERASSARGYRSAGLPVPSIPPLPGTTPRWQDELKRLLEGTSGASTPPVIAKPNVAVPPLELQGSEDKTAHARDAARRLHSRLKPSGSAYTRASQLNERVAARLKQVEAVTETAKPDGIKQREMREDFREVYSWTRHPDAARRAFIASTIFGPPKAFEIPNALWL
jgi:hypothetical protein